MVRNVKNSRPRGTTAISSQHQVTIPVDSRCMKRDSVLVTVSVPVRKELARSSSNVEADPLDGFLGTLTGVYEGFDLDVLRDEWA